MSGEIPFPSREWFEALAERMEDDVESFRRLGPLECTMVVRVNGPRQTRLVEVVFEGYGVKTIRSLESLDAASPDHFVLEASLETWREMLENIREGGEPDLEHTLNYLTFPDDPMRVSGPDQLRIDTFFRYNESLQRFFNGAAAIGTRYAM